MSDVTRPEVEPESELTPSEKLAMSLDMFRYGCDLMREGLRRKHSGASDAEIEEMLVAWLRIRPGAENGDGVGRPVAWPRTPATDE